MNKNLKIGLSLLLIASVFFLCSAVAFFILREAEREKRLYLEGELEKAVEARESITRNLEEIRITNRDLESRLDLAKEEAKRVSEDLVREKEAKSIIATQLEEEKRKSDSLLADVMEEKEERLNLVQQLARAEEAYRGLKGQYEVMLDAKETLEDRLKKMMAKKGVELEKIEVRSGYEERGGEAIEPSERPLISKAADERYADVLVVNRKFAFIVANIGKSDGLDIGNELDVYRDGEFIAKTRIEKVYDKMSAATILPEWRDAHIREGDRVNISP